VLVRGNHHQHWIDGHMTADLIDFDEKGRALEGVLAVQVHVGPAMKIQFKDFKIKHLPDDLPLLNFTRPTAHLINIPIFMKDHPIPEYRYTHDHLYDKEEHLYYRDAKFFDKTTPNGRKIFWSRGNGWVYGGLALTLEHLPKDHPTRGFYEGVFKEMTSALLAAQQQDGLWRPSLLDPEEVAVGETSGSGFFTFGLAWGIRNGLLDKDAHLPALTRAWNGLMTRVRPDGYVGYVQSVGAAPGALNENSIKEYGTGAFLLAGSEIIQLLGAAPDVSPADLLATAGKLIADDKTPRAYARLVPERKDDLAWENDKVAFRIYGPALRSGPEDSGIDVWSKRVPYPILDKWYDMENRKGVSYHKDHGEGLDDYKVGEARGCGGLGLWVDGKLVTSNTYISADILWTGPEEAVFHTEYRYPVKLAGKPIVEHRVTRLKLGERLCEIESRFSTRPGGRFNRPTPAVALPHEVAVGLSTQNKGAAITFAADQGYIAIHEPLAGKGLGTGVVFNPSSAIRTDRLPASGKNPEQALVFLRPDKNGVIRYRTGFAWAADGEIQSAGEWLEYLARQAKP
jgi:unsaturated rhamnogalacturonyl hydrolase